MAKKKDQPSAEVIFSFAKIKLTIFFTLLLATLTWTTRDFFSSLAATQMTATTRLRTTEEADDTRVLQAFEQARQSTPVYAALMTETNPQQQTRDAILKIFAPSKTEALAGLNTMTDAMAKSFARSGGAELYVLDTNPPAVAVPNDMTVLIDRLFRGTSLAILLAGFSLALMQWKEARLPRAAAFALLGVTFSFVILLMGQEDGGAVVGTLFILGVPVLLLTLVTRLTLKVRKATSWVEGRARILTSRVEVERHRFEGDTTKVRNKAFVEYSFTVGTATIQGDTISLGAAPADQVNETLKKYPVGAEVPVFYDPANPENCVLERDPPASLGCIWTGTVVLLLVYTFVFLYFWYGYSINAALSTAFPKIHHPLIVLTSGLLALLCIASFVWNRRHPRKAFSWAKTQGSIVSSESESYQESHQRDGTYKETRYYKAVIEFSYQVEGQEYHNILETCDGTSEKAADAGVTKYPVGKTVEVHYDIKNPVRSALEIDTEMVLDGTRSLIVGLVLLAIALAVALL